MNALKYLDYTYLEKLLKLRHGESKVGEKIRLISDISELGEIDEQYVLLGISEDIGVRANHGKAGTAKAWSSFLNAFLNTQVNQFNSIENAVILGEINCAQELKEANQLDEDQEDYHVLLSDIVQKIDEKVTKVLKLIFEHQKTPIIIGGGHNNAYGIIKGYFEYHKEAINVLNLDAHTDLRHADYRHSGNGFSYAYKNNFLDKYYVFGLHENYTPSYIFDFMESKKHISFYLYDELLHLNPLDKLSKLKAACNFLGERFGLEIDCDAIENFNSSAKSPSGFGVGEIRNMIKLLNNNTLHYIHICEAIPDSTDQVGKALSYFVSDLLRD
jgi:formiminoglutamase